MDSEKEIFEVEFTEQYVEELIEVYDYISNNLKEDEVAKKLISEINKKVLSLEKAPEMYMKIGKVDKLKRIYHRIVVKNYVILYTIDYEKKIIYVSRIIYGKRNYLN